MIVHPSLMLIASLDEREYNQQSAPDVKRAFVHLAPTTVRSHAATEPACNSLVLKVNFSKKYWLDADKDAAATWPVVKDWLAGKRYFVGENIKSFNKTRGERGEQTVDYREMSLLMAGNAIRIAVEPGCELPPLEDFADQVRTLANAGTIGDGKNVDVQIPSEASLAAQRAAHQAQAQAALAAAAKQAAAARAEVVEQPGEQPAEQAEQAADPEAPVADDGQAQVAEEPAAAEVPPLAIDYTVWGVVTADGTVREWNSATGTWL